MTSKSLPLPLAQAPLSALAKIKGICLDIDDTLSTRGKLTAEAFQSLWDLSQAGIVVVPITGRPAGWCDHIARFWPVDAVVGENGAFVYWMQNQRRNQSPTPMNYTEAENRRLLDQLQLKILQLFPQAQVASDQDFRRFDLAIDICEDVPAWQPQQVEQLLALCQKEGAHAKLSSIHVNIWFGDYNKFSGFQHLIPTVFPGRTELHSLESWIYIGDSPNDEPLFEQFPCSVGVGNLKPYLNRLTFPPTWITSGDYGRGFAELAYRLIQIQKR